MQSEKYKLSVSHRTALVCWCVICGAAVSSAAGKGRFENPFDAPVLDVRPRVFIRGDAFDGLTVAKLRRAARQPEFSAVQRKWQRKPLGPAPRSSASGSFTSPRRRRSGTI